MTKTITIIRTILKVYEEEILRINYSGYYSKEEYILYINKELTQANIIERQNGDETHCTYSDKGIDISSNLPSQLIKRKSDLLHSHILSLKNITPIELDQDSITLIEIYKIFYNENPDFSKKDIKIKVQSMMSILSTFGIFLGDDYYFKVREQGQTPTSLELYHLINRLYPLGEVSNIKKSEKITEYNRKVISIIGETIKEEISNEKNKNKALKTISSCIFYTTSYTSCMGSPYNILTDYIECTQDQISSSRELVKKINHKIKKSSLSG